MKIVLKEYMNESDYKPLKEEFFYVLNSLKDDEVLEVDVTGIDSFKSLTLGTLINAQLKTHKKFKMINMGYKLSQFLESINLKEFLGQFSMI
jgi:hypothetical protein